MYPKDYAMHKLRSDAPLSRFFPTASLPISTVFSVFSALAAFSVVHAQSPTDAVKQFVSVDAPSVALVHVRVVDGTGAQPADDQTILVSNGRIERVGPSGSIHVPSGARALDLSGHTVIPGIVGLHNHTFYTTSIRSVQLNATAPRLYLGSGVTTIRTTGSHSPYAELNLRRVIDAGQAVGPRMHVAGPYLNGGDAGGSMHKVNTVEAVRRGVDFMASGGGTRA